MNWFKFINKILSAVNKTVNENETIIIYHSTYLSRLSDLITDTLKTNTGKKLVTHRIFIM